MTAAQERVFCRVCHRMLPGADFYAGNRSTCRRCKVQLAAQRRRADPEGTAAARRLERARGRLRAEAAQHMLERLLIGAAPIWEQLCRNDIDAVDARAEWYGLAAEAVRDLEDELVLPAGTGLDALSTRRKRKGNTGNPA